MRTKGLWVCAMLVAGMLVLATGRLSPAARKDTEEDLLRRIARATKPVKKARYEVRLARVKLKQALDARENGDIEGSLKLLEAYRDRVSTAWSILKNSGRPAHKKPQGFKELDIALREDERYLKDYVHSISVLDREPVEKIVDEVGKIREEVLKVLFPQAEPARP